MRRARKFSITIGATAALLTLLLLPAPKARSTPSGAPPLTFGDDFWKRWGDGKGELSGYELVFPRYGELRKGVAVTVFVTETFSNSLRVKSDPGRHPKSDEFPVMKLNLVEDFSTGIYDYNLLTSAFVALAPVNGRPSGSVTKVSFSSQEWCGNVYGQLLFDAGGARWTAHSYFDGEADQQRSIVVPNDALSGDALLVWARDLAAPVLTPGEKREVAFVRSVENARLAHRPVEMLQATLSRDATVSRLTVPAGTFDVERRIAQISGGVTWTISVETADPHRIIQWETSDGEKASLLASERLEYWRMHSEKDLPALSRLGLKPRPPRTP